MLISQRIAVYLLSTNNVKNIYLKITDLSARQTQIIKSLRLYCERAIPFLDFEKKLSILFNKPFIQKDSKRI